MIIFQVLSILPEICCVYQENVCVCVCTHSHVLLNNKDTFWGMSPSLGDLIVLQTSTRILYSLICTSIFYASEFIQYQFIKDFPVPHIISLAICM